MNAKSIIRRTRDGEALTRDEIRYLVRGAAHGDVEPYQLTAWMMAVFLRGFSPEQTAVLTQEMLDSGDRLEFSGAAYPPADKHSTGGVGDKISFLVAPLVAAVVIGLLALRGPFRAAFLVSRPALEARARALLDGTDSSALATRPGWIGLFPIDSIEHQGEAVYFWVAGVGFFDRYGLTYSPSGQWPAKSGCSYRSWGRQTWRVCHEDW